MFVTVTGSSDPDVDAYFDLQPGFFWFTAIVLNVLFESSVVKDPLDNPVTVFILKWFRVPGVLTYIAMFYLLFREYDLKNGAPLLGIFVASALDYGRTHYSAHSCREALYWLFLALLPKSMLAKSRPHTVLLS